MRKPSPKLIGAFVSVAVVLLIAMTMFFGSGSLFRKSTHFILFFDQSVNGLNQGSAVKFRGVPVGSVSEIMIRANGQDPESSAIPVVIRIDRSRFSNDPGVTDLPLKPKDLSGLISNGLFAELSLESFITGQLFVELSVDRERRPGLKTHLIEENGLMEIPTLASSLDEIAADAAAVISQFSELDFQRLNDNVNRVLVNLAEVLEGIDSAALSSSISEAASNVSELAGSVAVKSSIRSFDTALKELTKTLRAVNSQEGPFAEVLETWTVSLTQTLEQLSKISERLSEMTEPEGSIRYELDGMLREMRRAAQSVRALSEFLEQNPNAILTGRSEE